MIDQLRTKADEAIIPVVCGDMATTTVPGEFSGVPGIEHHFEPAHPVRAGCLLPQRCPPPGARWPICNRTVVPDLRRLPPGQQAAVSQIEPAYIGLDSYDVVHQQVVSHHIRFGEDMSAQIFRNPHPYIWPAELDLMGELGGFALESRARTGGALSSPQIPVQVSVYRLAD